MIKVDKLVAAYNLLEEFLAAASWKLADEHTYDIQLLLVERSDFGSWSDLYPDFPCQDLHTIDELWVKTVKGTLVTAYKNKFISNLQVEVNIQNSVKQLVCALRDVGYILQLIP